MKKELHEFNPWSAELVSVCGCKKPWDTWLLMSCTKVGRDFLSQEKQERPEREFRADIFFFFLYCPDLVQPKQNQFLHI